MTLDTDFNRLKELEAQAAVDPVVFIDRFLYTFNPKQEPYHFPFELFPFQKPLVRDIQTSIINGYDIFIEKCREMGATYTVLDVFLWFWRYVPGSNFLIGSRKEQYVDATKGEAGEVSNKEESLFGKIEYTLNHLVDFMLPKRFDIRRHMTYMSLLNPENGNVIVGESSNRNFSRGGRFKAILMDEFAFWDHDVAAWGATADTTRCRIVLTTPGERPGKAKRLRYGKDGEKIKLITLPYTLDPRKTKEWLDRERERRSAEDFAREIMINWEASITGKVYPEIKLATVGKYPYQPKWSLFASWDFGLDGTAIQWWQLNPENLKMRLVDAYSNSDMPIQFYFPLFGVETFKDEAGQIQECKKLFQYTTDDFETMDRVVVFKPPTHFGDPDVAKRSLLTGTSTRQALYNVGIYINTKPESNDFASRRERTKVMLQKGIEVNETPGTDYWLESMQNARYPQRQETSQATAAINLPIHDWTSHHRTSTEYLAVNYEEMWEEDKPKKKAPKETKDTFAYHLERMRRKRIMRKMEEF